LPHTLAALQAGELSEWRAQILVRETATLTPDQRRLVDAEVAAEVDSEGDSGGDCEGDCEGVGALGGRLGSLGDRELVRRVRAVAYRVDAASVMARASRAQADRRVTIRPAPDTMAYVTALLPVAQAVAAHAALTVAADTARAAGDERGKGQVMADTFVTRLTGQETADAVPVEVHLVMTDRALLAGGPDRDETPAQLPGYGTVPAAWARALLTPTGNQDEASVWLRRLYTHPASGALVA
ncbi:HNH endonuclease, partial [Terrabacter sp. GCM10028922]